MLSSGYSFKFLFKGKAPKTHPDISSETKTRRQPAEENIDDKKRSFMKVAGVIGAGALATTLLPRKAEAFVFGSTPASNVVGLKKADNTRIDPAQETGGNLAAIAGKDFATQTTLSALSAKIPVQGPALMVASMPVTIASNQAPIPTSMVAGGAVELNDSNGNNINPAQDESIIYLRRIVKQIDSLAVVDSAQRQKVTIDSITGSLTLGTISTITNSVPTNVGTLASVDTRYFLIDTARNTYAAGIRNNLSW